MATTTTPSALTTLIASSSPNPATPISALTQQVHHNLAHQHLWTSLQIHEAYTLSPTQSIPLISGLPPQQVYIHPDEQAYMLEHGIRAEDTGVEREWVVPTAQGQTWSLRRLAEVFAALPERRGEAGRRGEEAEVRPEVVEYERRRREEPWGGKRVLLSMVNRKMGGEGTVVYYVVLEGAVKPRQN